MYQSFFRKYVDGIDVTKVKVSDLTYGSKNCFIYKGKIYTRAGITNDGTAKTVDNGILGERVWKDSKSGISSLRAYFNDTNGVLQLKNAGKWLTIYSGIDSESVRVRFETWLDSTSTIIKKRLYFVDGTDDIHEWNGAKATISSIATDNITIQGTKTLQQLGFDPTSSLVGTTISFTASSKTISDSANGLGVFKVGMKVTISGSTSNNGTFTIVSVASTGASMVVSETVTNESAGASITLTSSYTVIIVRFNSGVYAGQEEYQYTDNCTDSILHLNSTPSTTPTSGDLIIAKPFKHTEILTGIDKDDLYTYQNHLGVASITDNAVYFSSIETPLDFTVPVPASRTAISPFTIYLDGNYTAMVSRKNVLWISDPDGWIKVTKTIEQNQYDQWVNVDKFEVPNRNGALPFAVAKYKTDIIFFGQDRRLQKITTLEITGQDDLMLLSDDVEALLNRVNVDECRVYYDDRYVFITLPAESMLLMLDMIGDPDTGIGSYWQPPQTIPISHISYIDGARYGHSNTTDETYTLFSGGSDLETPIESKMVFGYWGGENRHKYQWFNQFAVDGRMNDVTIATVEHFYETDGAKSKDETIINGEVIKKFSLGDSDIPWGFPWAYKAWGGSDSESLEELDTQLKRFFVFDTITAVSWFEYRPSITITGENQQFHLLGISLNNGDSTRKLSQDLFIRS